MTENREALQAERDQLRRDNEALTRQVNELRSQLQSTPAGGSRQKPGPPSFRLSEGERADLEQRGVATSPWTGEVLIADEQGVQPLTDEARTAADRARSARGAGT
jgi:hypothetical protein